MPIKPENYKLVRSHFILLFGAKCRMCGQVCDSAGSYIDENGIENVMEFDHIRPNGMHRHDVSRSIREWEWFEAYAKNNLQLLCKICNIRKTDKVI